MLSYLKKQYRLARLAWKFIVVEEMKSPTPVNFFKRISLLSKGYHGQVAEIYNLKDYSIDDYFSDWSKAKMSMLYDGRNIRGGYQYGLNNKIFSTALLGQYLRVPQVYAIIEHGNVLPLHSDSSDMFNSGWSDACRKAGGKLVFKPSSEGRGRGVFILKYLEGTMLLDESPITEKQLNEKIFSLNEYIIVEFLEQGKYSEKLAPKSTNTIRMVTIIDPDTNKPHLATAVQRIGRDVSYPVDNWNRGGLCAEVNIKTGRLSSAATRETHQRLLAWYDIHPDTGSQIEGTKVPDWEQVKKEILETASRMAYYKFMSWDVVALDKGIAVIEADTVSGIETLQVHKPLLLDKKVRHCLENLEQVRKRN